MGDARDRVFLGLFVGFLGGTALRSFVAFGPAFAGFLVLLGAAVCAAPLMARRIRRERSRGATVFCAFILFSAALGVIRYDLSDTLPSAVLEQSVGETLTLTVLISEEPDVRENNTRLTVRPMSLFMGSVPTDAPTRERLLLIVGLHPSYRYGDTLRVKGILRKPENFTGENGREFDYVSYLAKDGIHHEMFRPEVEILERGGGSPLKRALFGAKAFFLRGVARVMTEPQASLLGGLLVGAKRSLGSELLDEFRAVGLIHLVVLSGYNVTLIADAVGRVFRRVASRRVALALSAAGIAAFAVMTGGTATVVRASLMALLVLVARVSGRTYDITRALFAAALVMVFLNPRILIFDPSFQLSFLATFALIILAPRFARALGFLPEAWKLRETVAATLATQLFVLPFLLFLTGELSLVALPVNVLVLASVPATMLAGFLAGVVALVGTTLALPFALIAHGLLSYILFVVDFAASLPFASISLPAFPFWVVAIIYGVYFVVIHSTTPKFSSAQTMNGTKLP